MTENPLFDPGWPEDTYGEPSSTPEATTPTTIRQPQTEDGTE